MNEKPVSQQPKITVFLGPGGALRKLDEIGILDREVAYYRALQDLGAEISFLSHGGREERGFASRMPGMRILCNWMGLPDRTYDRRVHQVHAWRLMQTNIVKSFDANGLVAALRANWAWQIPFVLRAGYLRSSLFQIANPKQTRLIERQRGLERKALKRATHVSVTTQHIADQVISMAAEVEAKLTISPNFVDTERFRPIAVEKHYDLIYVGRIAKEKNLSELLAAVKRVGITIAIVGGEKGASADGTTSAEEFHRLHARFGDLGGRIHWLGRVSNSELPIYINRARAFSLCSHYEGHPRALIEAMACGMPIIGANAPGIKNVLRQGDTGYLCDTDAESIAAAVETIMAQPDLMQKMGENARQFALENYSLPQLALREYELLQEIVRDNPVGSAPRRATQYLLRRNGQFVRN